MSDNDLQKKLFKLALVFWLLVSFLRFWHVSELSGLSYDDCAYAVSGKDLLEKGHGHWGDTLRPFNTWWVAFFHFIRGFSIVNVGIAFATVSSLGGLFLVFAAREFFPRFSWAPVGVVVLSSMSFLGALYGKQHLSSLLCTVPLSLWLYARYLNRERWKDWILCSAATGLVFLSHYNTILVLGVMLGLEILRSWIDGKGLKRLLVLAGSGVLVPFMVAAELGRWSYGWKGEFRYIHMVWKQMIESQAKSPPQITDGFLYALSAWEGFGVMIYLVGVIWLIWRAWIDRDDRRWLALAWLPFIGVTVVWLRVNLGYLSFPRLYVFSFPFLWMAGAGLFGWLAQRLLSTRSKNSQLRLAAGLMGAALFFVVGIQSVFSFYPSGKGELERYLKSHPTSKMVVWYGNPHIADFWFGVNHISPMDTKDQVDAFWQTMGGERFDRQLSPEVANPDNRVYLNRADLSRVCDLVILAAVSVDHLHQMDQKILRVAPNAEIVDFFHGAKNYLPILGDEAGMLNARPGFTVLSRLPMIRLYDLRGKKEAPFKS